MKKTFIWAFTIAIINATFGIRLGFLPSIMISYIVSDFVDFLEKDKNEELLIEKGEIIRCPKCGTTNKRTNHFCRECGEELLPDGITKESNYGASPELNVEKETTIKSNFKTVYAHEETPDKKQIQEKHEEDIASKQTADVELRDTFKEQDKTDTRIKSTFTENDTEVIPIETIVQIH